MGRRLLLVRLVLFGFLSCSVYFPFTHSCYDNLVPSLSPAAEGTLEIAATHDLGRSPALCSMPLMYTPSGSDGPCLACLWSHNLVHDKVITGLEIPKSIPQTAVAVRSAGVRPPDIFDSATRRGPPVCVS